jgi:hypothetical protein
MCLFTQRVELGEEGDTSEVYEWANDENEEYWDCCSNVPHFVV